MTAVSVVTLAKGRPDHLVNVVAGLARQTHRPDEPLIVAVMQDELYTLPDTSFPIRQIRIARDALPLATARNAAARVATGEALVFLDMDCIPTPGLVADYARFAAEFDGLLMGEVMYLPAARPRGVGLSAFRCGRSEAFGPPRAAAPRDRDLRRLSLLLVAELRDAARRVPARRRLNKRYSGYGGEDTDFGKTLDQAGCRSPGSKAGSPTTNITPTICRRSTISTAWCATPSCSSANGAIARWGIGSTPSA
ncbi:glycosyltransferase family 2 protein [Sphingomonas sp. MMS24-JH45]